jgi:hypothetical protein
LGFVNVEFGAVAKYGERFCASSLLAQLMQRANKELAPQNEKRGLVRYHPRLRDELKMTDAVAMTVNRPVL